MKRKFALIALLGLFLSGCDETDSLNATETILWRQCEAQDKSVSCRSEYRQTFSQVYNSRVVNTDNMPFANQPISFQLEDKAFKRSHPTLRSINEIWHDSTGRWIYVPDELKSSVTDEVKKVDNKYVLSPQLYDDLIAAVKTCNRATVSSMQFKPGVSLSPEDYNSVMNIILECKQYQLDKAINDK